MKDLNEAFVHLNVGLPDDVERLKAAGYYKEAVARIDEYLAEDWTETQNSPRSQGLEMPEYEQPANPVPHGVDALRDALLGAFVVAGTILVLVLLFEKIKGVEAMGGGDIKLLFMSGTFLGLAANIVCLLLSCLIGIFWGLAATVGKEEKTFPWGPSIAIGAWLALLFGNELAAWYLGLLA